MTRKTQPRKPWEKRSPLWGEVRAQFLAGNGTCAACGSKAKTDVHHIVPVHVDSSKELELTNLISLCRNRLRQCHFTFGHLFDWTSWNTNVVQDTAAFRQKRDGRPKVSRHREKL